MCRLNNVSADTYSITRVAGGLPMSNTYTSKANTDRR